MTDRVRNGSEMVIVGKIPVIIGLVLSVLIALFHQSVIALASAVIFGSIFLSSYYQVNRYKLNGILLMSADMNGDRKRIEKIKAFPARIYTLDNLTGIRTCDVKRQIGISSEIAAYA